MGHTGAELQKVRAFIYSYKECFAFKLTDLEDKGKPVRIQLKDNRPIFRRPYKLRGGAHPGCPCRIWSRPRAFPANWHHTCRWHTGAGTGLSEVVGMCWLPENFLQAGLRCVLSPLLETNVLAGSWMILCIRR